MGTLVSLGLVCKASDYRDSDRMLTLITPRHGRIDAIARGCKKSASTLRASAQLFAFGEYVLREKSGRFSVTQFDLRESFFAISEDFEAFSAGQAVLAVAREAVQPNQEIEELFALCTFALSFLCYGRAGAADLLLCFLLKFLDIQGFRPASTACARCGASTFRQAAFSAQCGALCESCSKVLGENEHVSALSLEAIRRMLRLPLSDMDKVVLPEGVRKELVFLLPPYFERQMERRVGAVRFFLQHF